MCTTSTLLLPPVHLQLPIAPLIYYANAKPKEARKPSGLFDGELRGTRADSGILQDGKLHTPSSTPLPGDQKSDRFIESADSPFLDDKRSWSQHAGQRHHQRLKPLPCKCLRYVDVAKTIAVVHKIPCGWGSENRSQRYRSLALEPGLELSERLVKSFTESQTVSLLGAPQTPKEALVSTNRSQSFTHQRASTNANTGFSKHFTCLEGLLNCFRSWGSSAASDEFNQERRDHHVHTKTEVERGQDSQGVNVQSSVSCGGKEPLTENAEVGTSGSGRSNLTARVCNGVILKSVHLICSTIRKKTMCFVRMGVLLPIRTNLQHVNG